MGIAGRVARLERWHLMASRVSEGEAWAIVLDLMRLAGHHGDTGAAAEAEAGDRADLAVYLRGTNAGAFLDALGEAGREGREGAIDAD